MEIRKTQHMFFGSPFGQNYTWYVKSNHFTIFSLFFSNLLICLSFNVFKILQTKPKKKKKIEKIDGKLSGKIKEINK